MGRRSPIARGAALAALAALLLGISTPAASAQDPYGGTTTTTSPPAAEVSCRLSSDTAAGGAEVTATVTGVPLGEVVRVLFAGGEVGRGTAAERDGQADTTAVQVPFTVPDVAAGTYDVTAVGSAFSSECSVTGFAVLAAAASRGGSDGRSALPRTGAYAALLVAIALLLLVAGRSLLEAKRRRQRATTTDRERRRTPV